MGCAAHAVALAEFYVSVSVISMIELSKDTKALLEKLFPKTVDRKIISEKLRTKCADNIYTCSNGTPESMERVRFAVLKLFSESTKDHDIDYWIEVARTDWRDLFMIAGFGYDIHEHKKWKNQTLTSAF